MIPQRRKKAKSKSGPQIRCIGHLKWIRGHECSAKSHMCAGRIEAAHVRSNTDGGMGVKPSDIYTIPLCTAHHAKQHAIGESAFEKEFKIDMRKIADALAMKSPHRSKWS